MPASVTSFSKPKRLLLGVGAALFVLLLALALCAMPASQASAAEASAKLTDSEQAFSTQQYGDKEVTKGSLTVGRLDDFGGVSMRFSANYTNSSTITARDTNYETITAVSSNPSVVTIDNVDDESYYYGTTYISFTAKKVGTANISISNGTDTIVVPVVSYPEKAAAITSIKKAAYNSVKITWSKVDGVSGYKVMRIKSDDMYKTGSNFKQVANVASASTTSVTVKASWNTDYTYAVVPYLKYGSQLFMAEGAEYYYNKSFALPPCTVKVTSVTKVSSKTLKVSWKADAGAKSYTVYRSTQLDRGFKKLATVKSKSYTDKKVSAGKVYYYKVKTAYTGCSTVTSNTFAKMITKKGSLIKSVVDKGSRYGSSPFSSVETYYVKDSRLYVVCCDYNTGSLKVYGFNSKMKKVSTKTVKLPKHDKLGGVYHAPDGCNYVALGYSNAKESKTKVVIKVVKYNGSWKKGKVASIKGSASNGFEGIQYPFRAGDASFDMAGSKLYLFTARTMFKTSDGLNHQSNIAFCIDTKTMKATTDNIGYVSHSFGQRVRLQDGSIYLADHGDAYPRSFVLRARGWVNGKLADAPSWKTNVFKFKGETGDNFTGASMGDLEVGSTNVLFSGSAQPHYLKVKGVSGFGNYRQNAFVAVTNKQTGKSQVKWLTTLNPKTAKQTVSNTRMVKISDDRFAVIYSIRNDSTGKSTTYYKALNGSGKTLLTKKYSGVIFNGYEQPVLYDGSICWVGCDYRNWPQKATLYKIPAL